MQNTSHDERKLDDKSLSKALTYVGRIRGAILEMCDDFMGISDEIDQAAKEARDALASLHPSVNIESHIRKLSETIRAELKAAVEDATFKRLCDLEIEYISAFTNLFDVVRLAREVMGENGRTRDLMHLDLQVLNEAAGSTFEVSTLKHIIANCTSELKRSIDAMHEREQEYQRATEARIAELETKLASASAESSTLRSALSANLRRLKTDPLTGAGSRDAYEEYCQAIERSENGEREMLSIILIDIDHFKSINDTYGHNNGDCVLASVAQRISSSLRDCDAFFRFGGEEFVIFSPSTLDDASQIAERIRRAVANEPFHITGGTTVKVTLSGGVSQIGTKELITSALDRADKGLYGAKKAGRNRIVRCNT